MSWRPLLVCCGMIATLQDPLDISSKGRPSFLSGKRRGSSNRVYDFDDADAEGGDDDDNDDNDDDDDCYAWGLE